MRWPSPSSIFSLFDTASDAVMNSESSAMFLDATSIALTTSGLFSVFASIWTLLVKDALDCRVFLCRGPHLVDALAYQLRTHAGDLLCWSVDRAPQFRILYGFEVLRLAVVKINVD